MAKVTGIQRFFLRPLSRLIFRVILRFQIFKLIICLLFLGGFIFCYFLLDWRRCGLVPRNVVKSGLVFYILDLAQHLIIYTFAEELVNKIFSTHNPYKLEIWYTLKVTFTVVEAVYFVLTCFKLRDFTVCTQSKVFITSYVATFASIHFILLIFAACCGEIVLKTAQKAEDLAQTALYKTFGKGVDALEDYVEGKLEPFTMIVNGKDRITRHNKEEVWKKDLIDHYDILEMEDFSYKKMKDIKLHRTHSQ